ncbi:MarR family transcriptional regulator [Paracraurococcus ruber]|uniref:HTH marR-type domain-containing protein n=1 Tax=Paracraurococcus ruber TaxID=77675 RepID=A0ABS1D3U7_9PROT|nr:MarR family transcriptional regulator [Paracraurococcus ruber]MBK1660937.1 hypothetical protein [Paracraurococcus ruber]TDG26717.1 MarR family transcriptional regulator [Paracraurococcus ruber]
MRDGSPLAHTQWRLGILIAQIARRWRARLDQRIAEYGLTEARWLCLLTISRGGEGMTQKDLAARLLIEGPTLVRTLDWLEAEGLVLRREAPHDRRAKTLHLSAKARPLIQRIETAATGVRAEILAGIPDADLAACLSVLERVATGLAVPAPAPPPEEASDGYRPA